MASSVDPKAAEIGAHTEPVNVKEEPRSDLYNELNPFEKSFSGKASATLGNGTQTPGTKLPSVSALASPSTGLGNRSPFGWNNSLKSGPLSPALLTGPLSGSGSNYFSDRVDRGFSESSLRTGLTPGNPSNPTFLPNGSLFNSFAGGASTPASAEFHRTALSAAHKQREQQSKMHQLGVTSEPRSVTSVPAPAPGPGVIPPSIDKKSTYDAHNDAHASTEAVNSLFMLAQGGHKGTSFTPAKSAPQNGAGPTAIAVTTTGANADPSTTTAPLKAITMNGRSALPGMAAPVDNSPESKKGKKATATKAAGSKRKNDSVSDKTPKKVKGSSQASDGEGSEQDEEGEDGKKMTEDEKRKNFLERNRIAALKCRQRKKQWLNELQTRVDSLTSENEDLTSQITRLRAEMVNLRTLLLAHKDCPVTVEQVVHGQYPQDNNPDSFNSQMNPYGSAASTQQTRRPTISQAIPIGQANARGFP